MKKIICLLIFTVLNMTICFGSTMFVHEYSTTTSEELRTSLNDCITVKLKLGNLAEENLTLPVYLNSIKEVYNCTTIASIEITGFVITTAGITGYPIKTGEHKFYFGGRILATIQDKDISRTTSTSVYIAPINSAIKPTTVVYLAGWGDDSQRLWDRNRRKIVPAKAGGISVVTGVAIDSSGLPSTSGPAFVAKDILESVGDISEEMNYTFTADVGKINTLEESITKQALILSDNLAKEGLKDNPKILIGHSQGGLRAFSYAKSHNDVKAIFSVGTPWKGAPVVQHQKDIIEYKKKVLEKVKSLNDKMESYYLGSVNIDKINKALASGIFDTISPSKEQKLADIAKPSAQDMNPKGFFIQNTVQQYTEKTKLVYAKSEKR